MADGLEESQLAAAGSSRRMAMPAGLWKCGGVGMLRVEKGGMVVALL